MRSWPSASSIATTCDPGAPRVSAGPATPTPARHLSCCRHAKLSRYVRGIACVPPGHALAHARTGAVVDLYRRHCCWDVEAAFLLVMRLLDLSYPWTGAHTGTAMQVLATWLRYAVSSNSPTPLPTPSAPLRMRHPRNGLPQPLLRLPRGRSRRSRRPVAFLAAQPALGILKALRPKRHQAPPDALPPELRLKGTP